MFNLSDFRLDRTSFWLGFLAASLLWWVWMRIRPVLPVWRKQVRQFIETIRRKNLAGIEAQLRTSTIRQAQSQHLAAPLFSLDEIVLQPRLIAPPATEDPARLAQNQPIASRVIPYLPDWPELVAAFGVATLTPAEAIQSGRSIAIIGQPGSGKTVALAHLACQIARGDPDLGVAADAIPLLVHIMDLDTTCAEDQDPLDNLFKGAARWASVVQQPQLRRFLQAALRDEQRQVFLLLDGLDELPSHQMDEAVTYLSSLQARYPRLQIVAAASADYLDGLTKLGFYPLGIAAWSHAHRDVFLKKWGELWQNNIVPEARENPGYREIDPLLLASWLADETAYFSPLEWTLRVWGAYAGDLSGDHTLSVLDAGISRFLPDASLIPALEDLAHLMLQKSSASLSFDEMEKCLSSYKRPKPATAALDLPVEVEGVPAKQETPDQAKSMKTRRDLTRSLGEEFITALVNGGILIEHANERLRFANPVLLGFLAGTKITSEEATEMVRERKWSTRNQALYFAAACSEDNPWIGALLQDPGELLFTDMLAAARWLRDAPPKAAWRVNLMRSLFTAIQQGTLPIGILARIVGAFYLSRDPATTKLLKQLLASPSPAVRRVALLGCGAVGNATLLNDVLARLADPVREVRYTACLALAALPGEPALNALVKILLTGDEEIRQAAAEALALNPERGHKVLEEAVAEADLLTRRAAVFGLTLVRQPWARKALEKLAIEDGQWVVRNAAAQALDAGQGDGPTIPGPLPPPWESPWLLTFASKQGVGILPGQPATDLLLEVMRSGTAEEKIAALQYLRNQADESAASAIYNLIYSGNEELSEPALHALWWASASGSPLPPPAEYHFA